MMHQSRLDRQTSLYMMLAASRARTGESAADVDKFAADVVAAFEDRYGDETEQTKRCCGKAAR